MKLTGILLLLAAGSVAQGATIAIGDADCFGYLVSCPAGVNVINNTFADHRSSAEQLASDGRQQTDIYSAMNPNLLLPTSFTLNFGFTGALTTATLSTFVGGLQATSLGALGVTINGISNTSWLGFEDGSLAAATHSFNLTSAMLAAANIAQNVQVVISQGTSNDAVIFDYFQLDTNLGGGAGVPEPSTWSMLAAGLGLAGLALARRKVRT